MKKKLSGHLVKKLIEILTFGYSVVVPVSACVIAWNMNYAVLTVLYFVVLVVLIKAKVDADWFANLYSLFVLAAPALLFIAAVNKAIGY